MQQGYLNYLKESLGIEDFILPVRSITEAPRVAALATMDTDTAATTAANSMAFYIQSADKSLSPPAQELLRKMTLAMSQGLRRDLGTTPITMLAAGNPFVEGSAAIKVLFTSDINSSALGQWSDGTMTTYSPELLLQKPELKKPTWAHLQAVMAKL